MTIFRGIGGGGDATTDAEINILTALTNQAIAASTASGASATQSATSATNSATSASGAATSASTASGSAATAFTSATNAAASAASINKDGSGGVPGLTLFKVNMRNVLNTLTSFFTNSNTVSRTYTLPDKDGTVAMTSDVTGTNSGTNTGDQTISLTGGVTGSGTGSFVATVSTNANLTGAVTSIGNATSLGSFTSTQLSGALTDETGTGANVFATSPTLVTPVINGFTGDTSVINIGSGQVYKDTSGNVGIGTSSAGAKLTVTQNQAALSYLLDTNNTTNGGSSLWRMITNNIANTGSTSVDFFKPSGSGFSLLNNDSNAANFTVFGIGGTERMRIDSSGNVGIGTNSPSYKLQVSTDSAGKPGVGGVWTVVSDERIKSNIVPANLDRCYEIVKSVPLKHFSFAPGVYTDDQIQDKNNLGWIAQDVQKVFKNAVSVKPFTLKTAIPDGTEDYEEQDFTLETVETTETSIQVINGKPVQVSKTVTSENRTLLFDTVDVLDEAGAAVIDGDKPLTYQMPRMITKTRPKVRHDVIEDCLDLNSGQMMAALYGAAQALMAKVELLEARLATA